MRSVLIWFITGIVLATALLGMSEIAQSASAFTVKTKSGTTACTDCYNGNPGAFNGPIGVGPNAVTKVFGCPRNGPGVVTPHHPFFCAP